VLARLGVDGAGQRGAAGDAEVHRPGPAERHQLALEHLADASEGLHGEVLAALLDAVDGALAGAEQLGQASLGEAVVPAGAPDELADLPEVLVGERRARRGGVGHGANAISPVVLTRSFRRVSPGQAECTS